LGYIIGSFFLDLAMSVIEFYGYEEKVINLNNEISPKTCQYIEDWVFVEIKTSKSK